MSEICVGLGPEESERYYDLIVDQAASGLGGRGAAQSEAAGDFYRRYTDGGTLLTKGVVAVLTPGVTKPLALFDNHGDPVFSGAQPPANLDRIVCPEGLST